MLLGLNNLVNRIRKGYEKVEKWKIDHPNAVGKVPNPFFYFNGFDYINVYTTESYFESPYSGVREYDYRELGENYSKWIEETQRKLLSNKTSHERKFSQILSQSKAKVVEQSPRHFCQIQTIYHALIIRTGILQITLCLLTKMALLTMRSRISNGVR